MSGQEPERFRDLVVARSPFGWSLERWAALWGTILGPVLLVWVMLLPLGCNFPSFRQTVLTVAVLGLLTLAALGVVVVLGWLLLIPFWWLAYKHSLRNSKGTEGGKPWPNS